MNAVVPNAPEAPVIAARALLVGRHLDLRQLVQIEPLGHNPLTIRVSGGGRAVLMRYGALVLFNVEPIAEASFLQHLAPFVTEPLEAPETEELRIVIDATRDDLMERNRLILSDMDVSRLQVVADVLGKSVLLADQEAQVARAFDRIEPLAEELKHRGRGVRSSGQLIRHIGETLLIQHRMVGRGEVGDKPEGLWDRPDLGRLYLNLEAEFEIRERQVILERKLTLINDTAVTLLDLLQSKRSLRVEWYIVVLIVIEIFLTLYQLFVRGLTGSA
jgi:uncharacterized Rmd1/YagE family protein